jgi:hypothetical protein
MKRSNINASKAPHWSIGEASAASACHMSLSCSAFPLAKAIFGERRARAFTDLAAEMRGSQ